MKRIKIAGACVAVAVVIGAALAPASYASPRQVSFDEALLAPFPELMGLTPMSSGSLLDKEIAVLTSKGLSPARAMQAISVQSMIGQSHLLNKLEAILDNAYAGAWFEPATTRLDVGATSPASRRRIAALARRVGLTAEIAIIPVRSAMTQLLDTQRQWNTKLAKLFIHGDVMTGLEPQRDAVAVTLSSTVDKKERTMLAQRAAASSVRVLLSSVKTAKLEITPLVNTTACKKGPFIEGEALCDKPITAGTRIIRGGGGFCTAGPAAIPTAKKNKTVTITAGHCVDKEEGGGGVGSIWKAKNRAGVESIIGPVLEYSFGLPVGMKGATYCGGLCTGSDFSDIEVSPPAAGGAWQSGKANDPVYAVTTEWKRMSEKGEETSYPVIGELVPVVKAVNCHEGQTTGESCGEVKKLNISVMSETLVKPTKRVVVEGEVEDAGENLFGRPGDSGGPFLSINAMGEAKVEGIEIGGLEECVPVPGAKKGPLYFKTEEECRDPALAKGGEGEWERLVKCVPVPGSKKGPDYFKTKEECLNPAVEGAEGEWERTTRGNQYFTPLKQPVAGAPEGPLEKLDLELLTKANEDRKPRLQGNKGEPLSKKAYTSKSGGSTFETISGSKVTCSADSGNGETTGTSTGTSTITFTGCEGFTAKCHTSGAAEGEVALSATYKLAFTNGVEDEVGLLLELTEATIECGKNCEGKAVETLKLRGTGIGPATPLDEEVVPSKKFTIAFSQSKGVQKPTEYETEEGAKAKVVLELSGSGTKAFSFEQAGLSDTDELLFEETAEIES